MQALPTVRHRETTQCQHLSTQRNRLDAVVSGDTVFTHFHVVSVEAKHFILFVIFGSALQDDCYRVPLAYAIDTIRHIVDDIERFISAP
ncbi:hypothetical protein CUJ89_02190 [Burkholderia pyrrocinia]|uniref:Uncharacterized protein n=1 Tax=Burkholderia pyrrocinia TaxID=60550 RepID=A0A2Z5MRS4_BURPY|nr:hypothetical protein CUJ89_02190 [Burkholderia pyrrocinia]